MSDKNIQMQHRNGSTWDRLYPRTKTGNVEYRPGFTLEEYLATIRNQGNFNSQFELIAHRGHSDVAPENTIPSFLQAIQSGFTSLECDIVMTADGNPVIIHDDSVDRTTNGTGKVSSMTLGQIRMLDASNGMSFYEGTHIPTLDEVLDLAKAHGMYLYPELKGIVNTDRDIPIIIDKITSRKMAERIVLQSFTLTSLQKARSYHPTITLGCLAQNREIFQNRLDFAIADQKSVMIVNNNVILANMDLVQKASDNLVPMISYGVVNSRQIQELMRAGVYRHICNDLVRAVGIK